MSIKADTITQIKADAERLTLDRIEADKAEAKKSAARDPWNQAKLAAEPAAPAEEQPTRGPGRPKKEDSE